MKTDKEEPWLFVISSKRKLIELNFGEIWRYRDLLVLFVKRDLVTVYKQTVLGPLWFLIQPLFTATIFTLVFNNIADISTGGIPPFLFNLAGITAWNYFKVCLTTTSATFRANAGLFGKVYFPRFIVPLSKAISNLAKFGIQLLIFTAFYCYYVFYAGVDLSLNGFVLLLPFYILLMIVYGLGLGMLITTVTTKYRDFSILLSFAVQLLMYVSAVPYPMQQLTTNVPQYAWVVQYNPLAHLIEGFRHALFATDSLYFSWTALGYTAALGLLLLLLGLVFFNRTEKTFIDTV